MYRVEILHKNGSNSWQTVGVTKTKAEAVAYIKRNGPVTGGRYGLRRLSLCPHCGNTGETSDNRICGCPAGEEVGAYEAALDMAIMAQLGK